MSLPWLKINAKLHSGIALINSVSTDNFAFLLEHIVKSKGESSWSPEELQKIAERLSFNQSDLQLVLQTVAYIYRQSSKIILKPTVLQKQLTDDLKFQLDKSEEFVKIWTSLTKEHFEKLESRLKLDNIAWELNLQSASSLNAKQAVPNVRVKLGLSAIDGPEKNNVVFELNETELEQMYHTLESIQTKLDFIQNTHK